MKIQKYLRYSVFITFLFTSIQALYADDIKWVKTFSMGELAEEEGYSVKQTTDGGYIICGYTDADVLLIKTNSLGDTIWTRTFGSQGWDLAWDVQQTNDEGYIIAGEYEISAADLDAYLIKTNSLGDSIWTKAFGGEDSDFATSVQQTSDNGYIVAGATSSFGNGSYDFWLLKTDSNSDTMWSKTYGGEDYDDCWSVQQTNDGGYILCGRTGSFGAGKRDIWMVRTNSVGDTMWTSTYGGSESEYGACVRQTDDEGYIITGFTRSFGNGSQDIWLIKTDGNGDIVWTKTYGGREGDYGESVEQTDDGGYIIAGSVSQDEFFDVYLIKTDSRGDTMWTKLYGYEGDESAYCVQQTDDLGYIVSGSTVSLDYWDFDIWLIKTDSLGNTVIPSNPSLVQDNNQWIVEKFRLFQNYPNPFNPKTIINYELPIANYVELSIYDLLGQKVSTLISERQAAGYHEVEFNGENLSSGVYLYRIEVGGWQDVKKMVYLK